MFLRSVIWWEAGVTLPLIEMHNATATWTVEGFCGALNRMPLVAPRPLTCDQDREMVRDAGIIQRIGVVVYFCDPHSPWQLGSNEESTA